MMKKITLLILLISMLGFSHLTRALNEYEPEDLADLTAVFVFLKNECGYKQLPDEQIKRAIVYFARQNKWNLSNYNSLDMKSMGEESYRDLSNIAIPTPNKCKSLARDSLSLLAYAN
jgi:hypothetical protein